MPIHDWTRVRANRFHHFHQDWTVEITRSLNRGVLPTCRNRWAFTRREAKSRVFTAMEPRL